MEINYQVNGLELLMEVVLQYYDKEQRNKVRLKNINNKVGGFRM